MKVFIVLTVLTVLIVFPAFAHANCADKAQTINDLVAARHNGMSKAAAIAAWAPRILVAISRQRCRSSIWFTLSQNPSIIAQSLS